MRLLVVLLLCLGFAIPVAAQDNAEEDRRFLERQLQEALSGAGREVRITGFRGALSSRARLERMTIADADGVWLILRDAQLVWTRRALFAGRLEVESLNAREVEILRRPRSEESLTPADAEVTAFALPELPVSVNINELAIEEILLAPPVLGEAAALTLNGAFNLAGGEGNATLDIRRTDRDDSLTFDGGFSNQSRVLRLDLDFSEASDGMVSGLLGIPGAPSLELVVKGEAPLSAYTAQIELSSDGTSRFGGEVTISGGEEEAGGYAIAADLEGDVRPLFAPEFHPFFGPRASLGADLRLPEDGRTLLDRFEIASAGLSLSGTLALAADGWPERFAFEGDMGDRSSPLRLPVAGDPLTLEHVRFDASYDQAEGDRWHADLTVDALERGDNLRVEAAHLKGEGRIARVPETFVTGALDFELTALDPGNEDLRRAIGENPSGRTRFNWRPEAPFVLESLSLQSGNMSLSADATVSTLAEGFPVRANARVLANDISRFSGLAGRDLEGVAIAELSGEIIPLSGAFDLVLNARTEGLRADEPRLDPLIGVETTLQVSAIRDEAGLRLRELELRNELLSWTASGVLNSSSGFLNTEAELSDIALVEPRLDGDAQVQMQVAWQDGAPVRLSVLDARLGESRINASGTLDPDDPVLPANGELRIVSPDLSRFATILARPVDGRLELDLIGAAELQGETFDLIFNVDGTGVRSGIPQLDRIIAGNVSAAGSAALDEQAFDLRYLRFLSPQLRANASGSGPGQPINLSARLSDLGLLTDSISGPAEIRGTMTLRDRLAEDVAVSLNATGPGGISALVTGDIRNHGQALALRAVGTGPLQLANRFITPRSVAGDLRFDLSLSGPPQLNSLSGEASFADARVALPDQNMVLDRLTGTVTLANGSAGIALTGGAGEGGRFEVSGPIRLEPPFSADLAIRLQRIALSDPELFETRVNGDLTVVGPLTGGARIGGTINLGRTEVQIPSGSGVIIGTLPQLRHVAEPADVTATRRRAGLVRQETGGSGRAAGADFPLDLTVNAPNQIFVRGRGLDAELGGSLRLTGSTSNIVPSGFFELIRGRIDILGRRLDLTEGLIDIRGAFDPYLRFVAESTAGDVVVQILLEGEASAPTVTFSSSPELPQDEVVARLIFGRGLDNLSAFQAVQLVSGIAQLTGRYDGGVVGNLRNSLGLSDLDVATSEEGTTQLRAGAYLADNLYSEVTADSEGKQQINLNLDVTRNLTVKGRADTDGETGLGIFFERDY